MSLFRRKDRPASRQTALVQEMEVPVFRGLVQKILSRLREPQVDLGQVAEALAWDPGLVAQVLKTVNSAAYGPRTPISDVTHAVGYMGAAALEQIVTVIAIKEALPSESGVGFEPEEFWRESGTRAALARRLSDHLHPELTSEVFTAGLLSDFAVPLLFHNRPGAYGRILRAWREDRSQDLAELERRAFGWDHADVGGELARTWGLPETLVHGISEHHGDSVAPALQLVSVLQDTAAEYGFDALAEEARVQYGVETDCLGAMIQASQSDARELVRALG